MTNPVYFQENIIVTPNPILVQLPIFVDTAVMGHTITTFDGFTVMAF